MGRRLMLLLSCKRGGWIMPLHHPAASMFSAPLSYRRLSAWRVGPSMEIFSACNYTSFYTCGGVFHVAMPELFRIQLRRSPFASPGLSYTR